MKIGFLIVDMQNIFQKQEKLFRKLQLALMTSGLRKNTLMRVSHSTKRNCQHKA
jgi:hypothetical protein